MSVYQIVLFIHVAAAMATFVGVGALFFMILALRKANTAGQVSILAPVYRLGGVVGVTGIVILGVAGLYLAWKTASLGAGWAQVAIGAFALLAPVGPLVVAPRIERIFHDVREAGDDPLPPGLIARLRDPVPKVAMHVIFGDLVGIVFVMTTKPSLIGSIVAILVFIAVGIGLALPLIGKAAWAFVNGFADLEESSPVYRWLSGGR